MTIKSNLEIKNIINRNDYSKNEIVKPKTLVPVKLNNCFDSLTVRGDVLLTQTLLKTSYPKGIFQVQNQISDII